MKIALSNDNGSVAQHFGRASSFTVAEIEDGRVVGKKELDNTAHLKGSLPEMLRNEKVDLVITGGMGLGAKNFLKGFGIEYITGACGKIEDVLDKYLEGKLESIETDCNGGNHGHN